jgi:predicted dehydrogenase
VSAAPLRIGLVGAGRIAQTYAEALGRSTEARLLAVADVREEAARSLAESCGARGFASHREMLAALPLDAAIVCTPPATHPAVCRDLIAAGLHVLCEKPFAILLDDARAMVDAARRASVRITMASKFRYVADVVRARSIIAAGTLGTVVLFENAFTAFVDMRERWNADRSVGGGGVLIDNGTHSLDLARYLLGPLSHLQVVEGARTQGLQVEETVHVLLRSAAGAIGHIDLSWSIAKAQDTYVAVYGTAGSLLVGWKASRYRLVGSAEWVELGRGYDKVLAFVDQIGNFARAVRGEEELRVGEEDAIASVAAMVAAYRALAEGRLVAVGGEGAAP